MRGGRLDRGFGVAAGCAKSVEAGVDGAVAIHAASGLSICGAAVWTAGFGVAAGCAESVEAGVDGAVVIGAPPGLMICEGTQTAGELGGTGANAGAVNSKPEEARFGAPTSALPPAETEPLFAGATPAPGTFSQGAACKGTACGLSCMGARGELEGSESVRLRPYQALRRGDGGLALRQVRSSVDKSKARADRGCARERTPPAVSLQRRDLGLVDF